MNFKFITAIAVSALVGLASQAQAFDLKKGTGAKFKVTKIQMGIKSPKTNACPANASMKIWVFSNKPGKVPVYVAKAGGTAVAGPYMVKTKATGNGTYMGTYSKTLKIHQPINAKYRASAPKFKKLSNWVPLKATCKIKLGGNGMLQKK